MSSAIFLTAIPVCIALYLIVQFTYLLFRGAGANFFGIIATFAIIALWLFFSYNFYQYMGLNMSEGEPPIFRVLFCFGLPAILVGCPLGFSAAWVYMKIATFEETLKQKKQSEELAKKQAIEAEKHKDEPKKTEEELHKEAHDKLMAKVIHSGIQDLQKVFDGIHAQIEKDKVDPVKIAEKKAYEKKMAKCKAKRAALIAELEREVSKGKFQPGIDQWN